MNTLTLLTISLAILIIGYRYYGSWLINQWGMDDMAEQMPSHSRTDGVDYTPTKTPLLLGHHLASIAGPWAISGPVVAALFGWLPAVIWIVLGGIFFGGVLDLGALLASVRHQGRSMMEIISAGLSRRGKVLFGLFAYLTLIMAMASLISMVADSFAAQYSNAGVLNLAISNTNASVAMISLLLTACAALLGVLMHRLDLSMKAVLMLGIFFIGLCLTVGMNYHPLYFSRGIWLVILAIYLMLAATAPVWILLQPRDFLNALLLGAIFFIALLGIIVVHPDIDLKLFPAVSSLAVDTDQGRQYLFPVLFTTITCGAVSGFHALVSSGTTAKQLDKVQDAKPIAYGGMLLESGLALLMVCAIASARSSGHTKHVTDMFAGGFASMLASIQLLASSQTVIYALLALAFSILCLTTLDTATRLGRYIFQELWLAPGQELADVKSGWQRLMVQPYIATLITVGLATLLGANDYEKIWMLFGATNQLLATLSLLAVYIWLGRRRKSNRMCIFPMVFLGSMTLGSLGVTVQNQLSIIAGGQADGWAYTQAGLTGLLIVFALFILAEIIRTLRSN